MRRLFFPLALTLLFGLAGAAEAYTIYLKDGEKIISKNEYEVDGDKAIITLPNGARTVIDLNQIDVRRTRDANTNDYGTAVVIDGGEARGLKRSDASGPRDKRLSDLIAERGVTTRRRDSVRTNRVEEVTGEPLRGSMGEIDLHRYPKTAHPNRRMTDVVRVYLRNHDMETAGIFQGTTPDRLMLEFVTDSESSVFRALATSASALLDLRDRFPAQMASIELVLVTQDRERAGQFLIDSQAARQLEEKTVEPSAFFLRNVRF